mmetsp:Transcript_1432/g.3144  ORF Transcript_1432/g.3144 Transcript_1432/m.3144 type:complete len:90 (+) Transcript_1432:1218-1487(+)
MRRRIHEHRTARQTMQRRATIPPNGGNRLFDTLRSRISIAFRLWILQVPLWGNAKRLRGSFDGDDDSDSCNRGLMNAVGDVRTTNGTEL